ncbi:phage tail protein [Providencia rettgeri]|uniref:phage tail-collar fiber domain-containing protein n=1 Tax=Providencia rettgeri TaxID=587 RepID=UPI001F046889|nr:phage tail protein [Providencia rettgeri]MCG9941621.1 phage tail protein [Providencia rettgeri]
MASVITVAFENWKAQEAASGKAVLLDEFVFANVPNLDPTKPIDRNEKLPPASQIVHRQAVNKAGLASENAVAYSVTMGADVGNFDFNWIGLLNKASGTVAMITHAPTQKKLKNQNGQQGNVLTRSFILEFQGAAEETQITTNAETWQIDFTARLSGIDEMQRLINVDSYGAAAFFNDSFEITRSGEQYTVKKGLGYVGGLRGELAQNQILNGLRNTKVYADFSYQGNIVSQWNTVIKITAAATLNNYVDAAGFTHQVFAIASIDANGNVKDLRPKGALSSQEIAALETRFKLDLSKKIDKANITSQTGNSTELVVNQHLLTTELGKKQPVGNYAPVGDYATNAALNNGLALKFDKNGGTVTGNVTATQNVQGAQVRTKSSADSQINLNPLDTGPRIEHKTKGGSWFQHTLPDKSGTFMLVGDYGFGTSAAELMSLNSEQMAEWLKSGAKLTQIVRNQVGTTSAFSNSPLAYFRTHDTWMAMSADYLGSGVRVIAGSSGNAFRIHTLLTNQTTTTDKNGIVRSTGTKTTLVTDDIAQNSGQSSALIMSQKATSDAIDAAKGVGVGQSWRKSDIAFDVSYTNSSSQPIMIIFNGVKQSIESVIVTCEINGLSIQFAKSTNSGGAVWLAGSIVIPAGSSYKFTVTSGTVGDFYTLG